MKTLKERLDDWTDIDVAAFHLGIAMGVFPPDQDWQEVKYVFWSHTWLGYYLVESLRNLAKSKVLLSDEDFDQVKWNLDYEIH